MSRIVVDIMPEVAEECPFAQYIQLTSKNTCRLKDGMYSRCDLECGSKTCKRLIDFGTIFAELKEREVNLNKED